MERNDRPPSGPALENIKKEPEYHRPSSTGPSPKPLNEKCSTPKTNSNTPTPNNSISQTPPLRQQSKCFIIHIIYIVLLFNHSIEHGVLWGFLSYFHFFVLSEYTFRTADSSNKIA